jgi:nitroreductase
MQKQDLQLLINQTRTVHNYQAKAVDINILKECLSLSLMAPNHRLSMPWKFKLVGQSTRKKLAERQMALKGKSTPEEMQKTYEQFANPAYLLVAYLEKKEEHLYKEDYATLSCSIQLLALTLRQHGIGYKWSTGKITKAAETYQLLNIDSGKCQIEGWIWIGHALADEIPQLIERPKLEQVLEIID